MRIIKATLAALALTGALAPPAAALEHHSFPNQQTQDGRTISQNTFWQVQPGDDGTVDVAFECYANASPPTALAMSFEHCSVQGEAGVTQEASSVEGTPGPWRLTAGALLDARDQRYRLCVQTSAFWQDNYFFETQLACSSYQ